MRRLPVVLFGLLIVAAVLFIARHHELLPSDNHVLGGDQMHAIVQSVADGDTATVLVNGDEVRVRLLGIDAPEIARSTDSDCGGPEALAALKDLMPVRAAVALTTDPISDKEDRFGRMLAYVATDTIDDVALAMIEGGYVKAWVPSSEPHPTRWTQYQSAQAVAQETNAGSWAVCEDLGRP